MADDIKAGGTGMRSYEDYISAQKIREPKQNLGKDDFLSLLAAQMSNQDPMEPTKDTEFVAQLAQFSSLEQINALNDTMSQFQSYSLTGKFVYAEVTMADGTKTPIAGVVDKIIMKDGKALAQVGDIAFDVSAIIEVVDIDYALGSNPLLQHSNLIGKYVRSEYQVPALDENGEVMLDAQGNTIMEDVVTEGYVTAISVDAASGMVAHLDNGSKLSLSLILDIHDSKPPEIPPVDETGDSGQVDETGQTDETGETDETVETPPAEETGETQDTGNL